MLTLYLDIRHKLVLASFETKNEIFIRISLIFSILSVDELPGRKRSFVAILMTENRCECGYGFFSLDQLTRPGPICVVRISIRQLHFLVPDVCLATGFARTT